MSGWLSGQAALILGDGKAADVIADSFLAAGAVLVRNNVASDFAKICNAEQISAFMDSMQALSATPLSILVVADAAPAWQSAENITLASWQDTTASHLDMRFYAAAECARRWIAASRPGAILHLMGRDVLQGSAGSAAQVGSAAGVENMVKTLAVEWARDGIRSNAIVSRYVEMNGEAPAEGLRALGMLACYLCSDYAAYVTGCLMGVNEL